MGQNLKYEFNPRYSLKRKKIMHSESLKPLYEMSVQYAQPDDCMKSIEDSDGFNSLNINTADGGGGIFYVLDTERWAFDDPQELIDLINDFVDKSKIIKDENNQN